MSIADSNCWCQLIADEDDEGSVLCGEFGRQRYLDHLDRKDLRIFPDLESIQHMLISLAPSYFWFPAAICHLIGTTRYCALLSLCCGLFWTRICKTSHGLSLVTSVFDCCNICQGFGQLKTSSSLNIPTSDNVFVLFWQCICTTSKFAFPLGSQGGLCCTLTQKQLKKTKNEIYQPFEKL